MHSVRRPPPESVVPWTSCCRCAAGDRRWDRIAGKAYCPGCEEALAQGLAAPLIERTEKNLCAICHDKGTVRLLTYPREAVWAVEMDLCPAHLRALLGRRLTVQAYHQLRRQLQALELNAGDLFLLHEGFYDAHGRALQPIHEVD